MTSHYSFGERSAIQKFLLIAGIVAISINLRPSLAGVGPLITSIRDTTGLSNTLLGLLTTLPLLAFGIISMLTPVFTRRLGIEGTLGGALFLLTIGILLRVIPSNAALFGGTLLLGIAIAFGNVLLPTLVKRDFPRHTGIMTSIYSSVLGIGATVAAGISVPLAHTLGWGWHWSLGSWAALSFLALLIWLPQLRNQTMPRHNRSFKKAFSSLGRSKLAWEVALFMGLQSLVFYVVLAWLPEILQGHNFSPSHAGWLLSLSQATGVAGSLIIPYWAEKMQNQRGLVWFLLLIESISLVGLLLPGGLLAWVWVSLIGFSLGASFGLALLLIVLRTNSAETATELSGMAQSIGYLFAALGPILFGALHDATGGWLIPILFLFAVIAVQLVMGLGAATPKEMIS